MDLHKFAKKVFSGKRERLDDRSWNNIEALEDISRGRNLPRIDIGDESINERILCLLLSDQDNPQRPHFPNLPGNEQLNRKHTRPDPARLTPNDLAITQIDYIYFAL